MRTYTLVRVAAKQLSNRPWTLTSQQRRGTKTVCREATDDSALIAAVSAAVDATPPPCIRRKVDCVRR